MVLVRLATCPWGLVTRTGKVGNMAVRTMSCSIPEKILPKCSFGDLRITQIRRSFAVGRCVIFSGPNYGTQRRETCYFWNLTYVFHPTRSATRTSLKG